MDKLQKDIEREKRKKEDKRLIFILCTFSAVMVATPITMLVLGKF